MPALHPKFSARSVGLRDLGIPSSAPLQPGTTAYLSASDIHHCVQEEIIHLPYRANGLAMHLPWREGQEKMPHAQQPAALQKSP